MSKQAPTPPYTAEDVDYIIKAMQSMIDSKIGGETAVKEKGANS